ncbi:hypothetical protein ACH4GM_39420 [Streptomyces coeruleorubidus]|uniref:hypothetical protein n=1 Tax=Streptomyces coeruleorubidus TaxID=116188 RepID=UPI00378B17AE
MTTPTVPAWWLLGAGGTSDEVAAHTEGYSSRTGTHRCAQRYIPMLLDRMAAGELSTSHLATHSVTLDEAPRAYDLFKHKTDGCVRAVIRPSG